jgi:ribonuclease HI
LNDPKETKEKQEATVMSDSVEMWHGYHYLGEDVTNNVAEYTGLIEGLKQAVVMNVPAILIQGNLRQSILYRR